MSNTVIDVTQPGTASYTMDSSVFDVGSDISLNLAGSSNHLYLEGSGDTINFNGTGNSVAFNANSGAQLIQYGSAYFQEDANGNFTYSKGVSVSMNSNTGIATFSLGGGNTVTVSNVQNAGSTLWASGTSTGISYFMNSSSVPYTAVGTTIAIGSWETLGLWGASNHVTIEGSDNTLKLYGDNNSIAFNANNGGQAIQYGNAYVQEDPNGNITYSAGALVYTSGGNALFSLGDGNLVTISNVTGSGSSLSAAGALGPVDVAPSGTASYVMSGVTFDVGSSVLFNLTGSMNTVNAQSGADTINLSGSNNFVAFDANKGAQSIQAGSAYVREDASGNIAYSGAFCGVSNGVATINLGSGNYVTVAGVQSLGSTIWAAAPVQQLVSAMASYGAEPAGVSSSLMTQSPAESSLVGSSLH